MPLAHLPGPSMGATTGLTAASEEAGVTECVGELYVSIKGKGTFVNGIPVHVNTEATKATAMAVFNFPYSVKLSAEEEAKVEEASTDADRARTRQTLRKDKMDRATDAIGEVRRQMSLDMLPGVRAYGSCVTTLALIAAGHVDLYVEPSGKVWDVVCGSLLVRESGGCVKNIVGDPFDMSHDTTIAAGATEELVNYVTDLNAKNGLGQYWIC